MNSVVYVGRMNRVQRLLDGVFGAGESPTLGSPTDSRDERRVLGRMLMPTPPRS